MRQDAKRKNLEEYLFGDLDLPQEPPSLTHLTTQIVRRRRVLQAELTPSALTPILPR